MFQSPFLKINRSPNRYRVWSSKKIPAHLILSKLTYFENRRIDAIAHFHPNWINFKLFAQILPILMHISLVYIRR